METPNEPLVPRQYALKENPVITRCGEQVLVRSIKVFEDETGVVKEVHIKFNVNSQRKHWVEEDGTFCVDTGVVSGQADRETWAGDLKHFLSTLKNQGEAQKILAGLGIIK